MIKESLANIYRLLTGESGDNWVPNKILPDDTYIVSYPKSGNTWVRFLIGNYITRGNYSFNNNNLVIPDLHMNPERCGDTSRPRFIKSHSFFVQVIQR